MSITFETTDIPSRAAEKKDITLNPYWPGVKQAMDNGTAVKFAVPVEEGDDYKRATSRVRSKVADIADHIDRTVRVRFTPEKDIIGTLVGSIRGEMWVMDRKIRKGVKIAKPEKNAPESTPESTPENTPEKEESVVVTLTPEERAVAEAELASSQRATRKARTTK